MTILGGGGITVELLPLLAPFNCVTTVIRKKAENVPGATFTYTPERLDEVLETTDLLILALALTEETKGIIDLQVIRSGLIRAALLHLISATLQKWV